MGDFCTVLNKKIEWVKRIRNIVHARNNINFMSKKLLVTSFEYKHNENFETVLTCEKYLQEKSFGRSQKSKAHLNKTGEKVICKNCEILCETQKRSQSSISRVY